MDIDPSHQEEVSPKPRSRLQKRAAPLHLNYTMKTINPEDYYMTAKEVAEFLEVSMPRVRALDSAGQIKKLKGAMFDRASVEAYKLKRGDKKGGRYLTE